MEKATAFYISTERTNYIVSSYIIGSEGEMEKATAFYISTERTNYIVSSYIIGSEGEMEKATAFYISTERTNYIVSSYIILIMGRKDFVILGLFAAVLTMMFFLKATIFNSAEPTKEITIGEEIIKVAIADTPILRSRGLSGVSGLNKNEGMLFIFDYPDYYGFWMKDMKFPLDIIWLDETGRIVHIAESATPLSYPNVFTPTDKARYVLEVNSGFSREHNLKAGDTALIKP